MNGVKAMGYQKTDKPTYEHTLAILPEVRKADALFWQKMDEMVESGNTRTVEENDQIFRELIQDLNIVLEKAIQAIYEDTKDRNSKTTLEQVFRAREPHMSHFGINPVKAIEDFIHIEDLQSDVSKRNVDKGKVSKNNELSTKHH
jgi:hypothetical protein